jgi:hypothetical protein
MFASSEKIIKLQYYFSIEKCNPRDKKREKFTVNQIVASNYKQIIISLYRK